MTLDTLQDLLRLTLVNPRAAATRLKALNLPVQTGWSAMLLVSVVSAFLGFIGFLASPIQGDPGVAAMFGSPLRTALFWRSPGFWPIGSAAALGARARWRKRWCWWPGCRSRRLRCNLCSL